MLLAEAERRLGTAARLAAAIPDGQDAGRVIHPLADILRTRIFAIVCGYEDPDDLDTLRFDPASKLTWLPTLRLRLLKRGARVIETVSRVRLAFAAACPEAPLVRHLAAGP